MLNIKNLKLIYKPDPRLYQQSEEISEVTSETRALMHEMLRIMKENSGIGLAAVQLGILKKIIVIDIDFWLLQQQERTGEKVELAHDGKTLFLTNAEILSCSDDKQAIQEGCLSVKDEMGDVLRPSQVTVRYRDYDNKIQTRVFGPGLLAACVQHEIDHTNGILFTDRLAS